MRKHYTIDHPHLERFYELQRLHKPAFKDAVISDTMAGWTTLFLPNWEGSMNDFYRAISPVWSGPTVLGRFAPSAVDRRLAPLL